MSHRHNQHSCEHNDVRFCKSCRLPYCESCGKEWGEKINWHNGYFGYDGYFVFPGGSNATIGDTANIQTVQQVSCTHEAK